MARKHTQQNKQIKIDKQPPPKKIRKPKLQNASTQQVRDLVQRRFEKQKKANTKQNKTITPKKVKACLDPQHFNCSICLDLMASPTTLCCGHSFCLLCIEQLNKTEMKYKCSLCRDCDHKIFYEIDKTVDRLMTYIQNFKLKQGERIEYKYKKEQGRKELAVRGVTHNLKPSDQIKIRVKNTWEKGRILSIHQTNSHRFYSIQVPLTGQIYSLPIDSVNIALTQDYIKRMQKQSRGIFSENIFIDDYPPRLTPTNTYNIDELLWEVNYYSPPQNNFNGWSFTPEIVNQSDSDSQSVQFLGRQNGMFGRSMREAIDID